MTVSRRSGGERFHLYGMTFSLKKKSDEHITATISEYDDYYVGEIESLGIITQAKSRDLLIANIKEALLLAYE